MSCKKTQGCPFYNGHDGECVVRREPQTLEEWLTEGDDVFLVGQYLSEIAHGVLDDEAWQHWEKRWEPDGSIYNVSFGWLVVVLKDGTAVTYCVDESL